MNKRHPHLHPSAFSMLEILVVIGILVVLMAILIPSLGYVREQAKSAGTVAILASIGNGLDQYHTDHNIYPPSDPLLPNGNPVYPGFDRGGLMLTESLVGYLNYDLDGAGAGNPAGLADPLYGFRTQRHARAPGTGKIYGPYMDAGGKSWKIISSNPNHQVVVDAWNSEILYFRAVTPTVNGQRRPIARIFGNRPTPAALPTFDAIFVIEDSPRAYREALPNLPAGVNNVGDPSATNNPPTPPTAPTDDAFARLLGASNPSSTSAISAGDLIIGRDSYLLVSAGPDRLYFTKDDIVHPKK